MNYKNLISVNENFQYSVNLQFDLNNITKISEYIPTKDSCYVIKNYINSILNKKNRSTTLVGPYGKGKSHLLLIVLSLINNYETTDEIEIQKFLKKVEKIDKELFGMINELRSEKKKILPIIINSNYNDLNQAFLLGMSEALERDKLNDLVINTYFDVALKVIEKWEDNHKEAISNIKKCLNEHNCTLKKLKIGLKEYSQEHYEMFKSVYSCVLHGQEFSPLVNGDIIKIYKDIVYEISKLNYKGVFIVFDEFSKFLENVDNSRMMKDLKILQDFAELAARTGNSEQIHLACITHKTINEYLKNLKEDKVNAFKTVEGRFKEIYFNSSLEQNYEIISYALNKKVGFDDYYKKFYISNKNLYDNLSTYPILKNTEDIEKVLFEGCFPLNPLTTYSLIALSERIAQNERTLFTFLTDDDGNGLKKFILDNSVELFTVDKIYDYFKSLFKKDSEDYIRTVWIKTENALKKSDDEITSKILKSLAIVYMINDTENFVPDEDTISLMLNIKIEEVNKIVDNIVEKGILRRKKITNELIFTTSYNSEISKEIKRLADTKYTNINEKTVIEKIMDLSYILPRRYNEKYKMTRYFANVFMTEEELENISNFDLLLENKVCDGVVINLLKVSKNINELRNKFQSIGNNRVVIKNPKQTITRAFTNLLKEYEAIQYMKSINSNQSEVENELDLMSVEIKDVIIEAIKEYFDPENIQDYWYLDKINRKVKNVSSFISDICSDIYNKTPIINNELINKNELSAPIKKARNIVIDSVLLGNKNLIQSKTSAEATIYKAVVDKKENKDIAHVLDIVAKFIENSDSNKINFNKLYEVLEKEPYSIRKGIIPLLISIALYKNVDNVILYYMNKEIDLDSNNLIKINENPDKYYLLTEKGTAEKIKYLSQMLYIFNFPNLDTMRNNIKILVDGMKKWMLSLPRVIREANASNNILNIKESFIELKNELLLSDLNNNEFLYTRVLEIFDTNDFEVAINEITTMKKLFDNYITEYINILVDETKTVFDKNYSGSLSMLLKEWYSNIKSSEKNRIFDSKTKQFLNYISDISTYNDSDVIEKISRIITGVYVEDWTPNSSNVYFEELKKIVENVKNKTNIISSNKKILFVDGEQIIEKLISEDKKVSPLGSTLKNNLEEVMSEYGDSLTENEKVNILLEIIKEYI